MLLKWNVLMKGTLKENYQKPGEPCEQIDHPARDCGSLCANGIVCSSAMGTNDKILYLASGNNHKVAEFAAMVQRDALALNVSSARSLGGMPAVAEDSGTFVGNARKKALALRALAPPGTLVMADDSGVCVEALGGAPGVESAYYAGPAGDTVANLRKLTHVMRNVSADKRGAKFYCLLLLLTEDGTEKVFEGECRGTLLVEPRGNAGFGYDPLFVPDGYTESYAELGDEVKSKISHRARAWAEFVAWFKTRQTLRSLNHPQHVG